MCRTAYVCRPRSPAGDGRLCLYCTRMLISDLFQNSWASLLSCCTDILLFVALVFSLRPRPPRYECSMMQGTGEHPWFDADAMEQQIESMVESAVSYLSPVEILKRMLASKFCAHTNSESGRCASKLSFAWSTFAPILPPRWFERVWPVHVSRATGESKVFGHITRHPACSFFFFSFAALAKSSSKTNTKRTKFQPSPRDVLFVCHVAELAMLLSSE